MSTEHGIRLERRLAVTMESHLFSRTLRFFELVSSLLALDATEPVSQPVTQMAVEMINSHVVSVQQKR